MTYNLRNYVLKKPYRALLILHASVKEVNEQENEECLPQYQKHTF